jgi:hypothetical protein
MNNLAEIGPRGNLQGIVADGLLSLSKNDLSDVSEAITAVLRAAGFKHDHTRMILAALAEADGRTTEFSAYFASLGARMKNKLDPFAEGEQLKAQGKINAQRWRRALEKLEKDQQETGFCFVACQRGGSDRAGHNYASKMTVDVATFVDAVQLARSRDDFSTNRRYAFEEAARAILTNKSQKFIKRLPAQKLKPEDILKRLEKTLTNSAERIVERAIEDEFNPDELAEIENRIIQKIRLSFYRAAERFQNDTPAGENQTDTLLLEEVSKTAKSAPVSPVMQTEEGTQAGGEESLTALLAFETVGASSFDVTLKNEESGKSDFLSNLDGAGLRSWMPGLLKRNREGAESLIIRPRGASTIQIDDCSPAVVEQLQPFSFLTVETSSDNFQVWLALPVGTSEEELKQIRSRLLEYLKPTGANGGAYGAVRWAGSINRKPERNGFRVRLRFVAPAHVVTGAELEGAGLLESPSPAPSSSETRPKADLGHKGLRIRGRAVRSFPSYAMCLAEKDGDRSKADASFLKLCELRGFSMDEATAELEQVSERAREEKRRGRKDYVRRTWDYVTTH